MPRLPILCAGGFLWTIIANLVEDFKQIVETLMAAGWPVRGILLNVAEFEVEQLSERAKKGLEHPVGKSARGAATKGIVKCPDSKSQSIGVALGSICFI